MTPSEQKRIVEANAALKDILLRHTGAPGIFPSAVDGLYLARREENDSTDRCFERPLASIILQGRKRGIVGTQELLFHENQCLVCGLDMPSVSYFLDASRERPFLSIFFSLDQQILTDLLLTLPQQAPPPDPTASGISLAPADPDVMEALLRLARLLDRPEQIAVLAPMILRELHYLLLTGPQGHVLRTIYAHGSRNGQIVRAISLLRSGLGDPLRMEELAREVGMSLSSLNRHFRRLTGFSPLQYRKQLRLYEARRKMLMENERAATAAFSVGYESVTQFNREYKRMFGEPPHRDILRRQRPVTGVREPSCA